MVARPTDVAGRGVVTKAGGGKLRPYKGKGKGEGNDVKKAAVARTTLGSGGSRWLVRFARVPGQD
jgi:hypothetical protein